MQVRDRAGMEKASCECYAVVKKRFDAFLSPPLILLRHKRRAKFLRRDAL